MNNTYKQTRFVLWLILILNFLVAVLKIIIGTAINSASITADGFHSLSDGSSNIVGLIGIHFANKPIDDDHPYGHQKFETLASLLISFMLFVLAINIILDGFSRIFYPIMPEITVQSIIVLVITLLINIFVCIYEYKMGKKINSNILINDSKHTKSDIFITIGVLITIVGIKFGLPIIIDTLVSFVVSGFIIFAAYEIFKSAYGILVDEVGLDTEKIENVCGKFEQIKNIHKIRSRKCEDIIYIDLHIVTDPNMSVEESHNIVHTIEDKLQSELSNKIEVIAHLEPLKKETD